MASAKKLARLLSIVIKEMPSVIPSSSVSIFSFVPRTVLLERLREFKLTLQNTSLDGKFVDVVGLENTDITEPKFKSYKEASKPIRTIEFLSYPVMSVEGSLSLNIQLTAPSRRNHHKYSAGFTNIDEIFLQILATVMQAKLHQINALIVKKRTE